jgi:hypothetical protein
MNEELALIDLGAASEETLGIPLGEYEDLASETHMD